MDDPLGKAFYDGSFSDTCFTCKYRVILSSSHQDVYDLANLFVERF